MIKISQELKMLNELLRIILKKYQEEKNFKIFFLNIFYLFLKDFGNLEEIFKRRITRSLKFLRYQKKEI